MRWWRLRAEWCLPGRTRRRPRRARPPAGSLRRRARPPACTSRYPFASSRTARPSSSRPVASRRIARSCASTSPPRRTTFSCGPPPARVEPADFVRLSQLYARHAEVTSEPGERHETATWSEIDTAQWMARQPRARAWFRVPRAALGERVRDRTVGEMVEAAEKAGAPVRRDPEHVTVETVAGITTTLGGLTIDRAARAAPGVFVCGADAGGIATGGYASGLAAALVFGRIAARAALGESPCTRMRGGRPAS